MGPVLYYDLGMSAGVPLSPSSA